MTSSPVSQPSETTAGDTRAPEAEPARVAFRQPVSDSGYIDAAWWPRTRDLAAELAPLLDGLWSAGRDITRVTYLLDSWDPAPRRMVVGGGRTVRLGGFRTGSRDTIRLTDASRRERIDILVVAPDTDPRLAECVMTLASQADNPHRPEEILTIAAGMIDNEGRAA